MDRQARNLDAVVDTYPTELNHTGAPSLLHSVSFSSPLFSLRFASHILSWRYDYLSWTSLIFLSVLYVRFPFLLSEEGVDTLKIKNVDVEQLLDVHYSGAAVAAGCRSMSGAPLHTQGQRPVPLPVLRPPRHEVGFLVSIFCLLLYLRFPLFLFLPCLADIGSEKIIRC